jgi:hypothetical protein
VSKRKNKDKDKDDEKLDGFGGGWHAAEMISKSGEYYMCNICGQQFETRRDALNHVRVQHHI